MQGDSETFLLSTYLSANTCSLFRAYNDGKQGWDLSML